MNVFTMMICISALFGERVEVQEKTSGPDRGPPRFVVIEKVDKATATVTYQDRVADLAALSELHEKMMEGKQPLDAFLKLMGDDLSVARDVPFPLKTGKVFTADGMELSPEESLKRLSPGSIAIVSTTGRNIDPAFQKLLQKDAIVLAPPVVKDIPRLPPAPRKKPKR